MTFLCAQKPSSNCCGKSVVRGEKEDRVCSSHRLRQGGRLFIRTSMWKEHAQRRVHFLETSLSSPRVEKLWGTYFRMSPSIYKARIVMSAVLRVFPDAHHDMGERHQDGPRSDPNEPWGLMEIESPPWASVSPSVKWVTWTLFRPSSSKILLVCESMDQKFKSGCAPS